MLWTKIHFGIQIGVVQRESERRKVERRERRSVYVFMVSCEEEKRRVLTCSRSQHVGRAKNQNTKAQKNFTLVARLKKLMREEKEDESWTGPFLGAIREEGKRSEQKRTEKRRINWGRMYVACHFGSSFFSSFGFLFVPLFFFFFIGGRTEFKTIRQDREKNENNEEGREGGRQRGRVANADRDDRCEDIAKQSTTAKEGRENNNNNHHKLTDNRHQTTDNRHQTSVMKFKND